MDKVALSSAQAYELCQGYIAKHKARLFTQCWGCLKFSKGNPEKMCFYKPPEFNGCNFVNKMAEGQKPKTTP